MVHYKEEEEKWKNKVKSDVKFYLKPVYIFFK